MKLNGITDWISSISEVFLKMAYLNILWMLFTILGLGIFGFMPATVSLFAVIRKWIMQEKDVPVFLTFWGNYRKEFLKSNLLGLILFILGYILYIDLLIFPTGSIFFAILRVGLVAVVISYIIMLLYIFPVFVHYDWKILSYIKHSLLLGVGYPHFTFIMVVGIGALAYITYIAPGIIPLFGVSILAYIIMWIAYLVIKKTEELQAAKTKNTNKTDKLTK